MNATMTTRWSTVATLLLASVGGCGGPGEETAGDVPSPATRGAASPAVLASRVLELFAAGQRDSVAAYVPAPEAAALVGEATGNGWALRPGFGRVVREEEGRAFVLLAGHPEFGNWGDETIYARGFSGVYETIRADGAWRMARRVPLDGENRILSHTLDVEVDPRWGLRVVDTLRVSVGAAWGFAARLNHGAEIQAVSVDGAEVPHEFGGGVLWVDAPPDDEATIALRYVLPVAADSLGSANSARFTPEAGHVRNQYFWHPFFDFASESDRARFHIRARVPMPNHLTTSLPQAVRAKGGFREAEGRSALETFALTLMYDRRWRPRVREAGPVRLELFTTEDFRPPPPELEAAFVSGYELLDARFGPPKSRYFAVAQGRRRSGSGWHFRSNDLIVTGVNGGRPVTRSPTPRAYFGHELAHGWTTPTGPGTNFLMEGWATFAEALLIREQFGSDAERAFWESQRARYETRGFEGTASLLDDPFNSGIAYSKGSWIFRSLEALMGDSAFDRAMADYMSIPAGRPAGIAEPSVALGGDLSGSPLPAEWAVGAWTVTVPLTEGRYAVYWIVDGEPLRDARGEVRWETREVRPDGPLESPHPRASG